MHALQATTWYTYGAAYEKDYIIAGYDDVTVVSQDYNGAPLRQTEHHFHNPHNNNASSEELRGREYLSKAFSAGGVLLQQVDTHWSTMPNGTTTVAHADQVVTTDYSGGETVSTRVNYTYDVYGNVTQEYDQGTFGIALAIVLYFGGRSALQGSISPGEWFLFIQAMAYF